jgi:uncharacterized protein DUF397
VSTVEFSGAVWRKSTRSGAGVNDSCVEVAFVSAAVGVRDSKNRTEAHLAFGAPAWRAFAEGLKTGC